MSAKAGAARTKNTGKIRIGISGWRYTPWRHTFYPARLPQKQELAYAASQFSTIEINGTFYSLQRPNTFEAWAEATPDDFVFAIKGSRYITHFLRLRDVDTALANFFASGLLLLGDKLGPILWQFPPNFAFDRKRIENFLRLLPRDTSQVAALARRHEKWMKGRASAKCLVDRPVRHAMEIRHNTFEVPEFIDLLRQHDVALVCADSVEWPRLMDLTSNFAYCRLHGSQEIYVSGYDSPSLDRWARYIRCWSQGLQAPDAHVVGPSQGKASSHDVFVYFDNDVKVRAPADAKSLMKRLNITWRHW
jgi:uncharacterized protein YecE (DUF72 family)